MAVGIGEIALGLGCCCAVGFPGQATLGHRSSRERIQIRRLQAGVLSGLDRFLSRHLGFGGCRLGVLPQLSLLIGRCIRLLCSCRLGSGLLRLFLLLPCRSSSGLRLHLLAGLTDFLEAALLVSQFIRQVADQLALAVLAVFLSIQDLGLKSLLKNPATSAKMGQLLI
jgi:hypothetical protein